MISDTIRNIKFILCNVYKEWVKSQTQLYYYVAIWWKVANNYMFRP